MVARCFTQIYGIDYEGTFALVTKMNSIKILLSLAANLDWSFQQFDVKNTFLHGDLEEEVYMEIPPGLHESSVNGKVCKLKKALDGLKQSPRACGLKDLLELCKSETTTRAKLIKWSLQGKVTALIVYVDDIILTGNNTKEIQKLRKYLAHEFEIKDLSLKCFLGIKVARSRHGIFVS